MNFPLPLFYLSFFKKKNICNVHKFFMFCVDQQCYCHTTTLGELFVISSTLLSSNWYSSTTTPRTFPQQHLILFLFQKKSSNLFFYLCFSSLKNKWINLFFTPFFKSPKLIINFFLKIFSNIGRLSQTTLVVKLVVNLVFIMKIGEYQILWYLVW